VTGTIHLGGGGDTFRLLDHVRGAGFEQAVRGLAVLPHYDHTQAAAHERSRRHTWPLVGVPERSGLAMRDGDAEVVGHESVTVFDGPDVTVRQAG
jgi:hypothetical protein